MKKIKTLIAATCFALLASGWMAAEKIVILHTNDTHSSIEPDAGRGGIMQRKAVMDSVKNSRKNKNIVTIDAGDAVQGSLYFKYFRGDVEYPLMNMSDYDIRILGNHEFDNGLESMASYWKDVKGERLSANYDFSDTPLKGMFKPYTIKNIGGKKIGFVALNVDPASLISKDNTGDMKFLPIIETANKYASMLKRDKKCDLVVAVTHIGYENANKKDGDVALAQNSEDIDVIIGGHSHTLVNPDTPEKTPYLIKNKNGRDVLVTQTGKGGKYVGQIVIDTDKLADGAEAMEYTLIPVTDRFENAKLDQRMAQFLAPYKEKVDSVNQRVIARSLYDLDTSRKGGYANWTGDLARWYGNLKLDSLGDSRRIDIGFMNVGGIRQEMRKGDVTEGQMLSTFPFSNRMVILEISGQDIIDALKVSASKGGEAISGNVRVVTTPDGQLVRAVMDDREIDPDKTYLMATIDYVAEGNDDLVSLANGKAIWNDDVELSAAIIRYIDLLTKLGLPIAPDRTPRFLEEVVVNR